MLLSCGRKTREREEPVLICKMSKRKCDIKTNTRAGVLAVPITSVAARVKGSDATLDDKKKEAEKRGGEDADADADMVSSSAGDDLEEVVYVLKADNTVEKRVVTTGIQDINFIEITTGIKAGEKVITAPYNAISKTLKPGDKVKVVSKEELFEKK